MNEENNIKKRVANMESGRQPLKAVSDKCFLQKSYEASTNTACNQTELSKTRVIFLNLSWFGMNSMYLILSVEVVPSQVHALVGSEMKGQIFGAMVASGAIVTFLISPWIGIQSDRLASPFGKRRPFMVCGTVLLCISLFGMAFSAPGSKLHKSNTTCEIDIEVRRCAPYTNNITYLQSLESNKTRGRHDDESLLRALVRENEPDRSGKLGLYFIFYLCVMATYAMIGVPYNGLIADQTPPSQRGFSSGVMGAMTLCGNIAGAILGFFYTKFGVVPTYGTITILFFVCVMITVIATPEKRSYPPKTPLDFRTFFSAYWEPLKENDFRWVFITRFLMQQAIATVVGFLEFWLGDMVNLPNCWSPENAVAIVLLPLLLSASVFSVIGGFLSDRLRRRKPLVTGSAILMAICSLIFTGLQGNYAFYAVIPVSLTFGIGFGAYLAVDFALVMDVLPDEKDKAKDLAVWHQALVLPQAVATPIGGVILDGFNHVNCRIGLGYIILFFITSVYFATSGYLVKFIKRAK